MTSKQNTPVVRSFNRGLQIAYTQTGTLKSYSVFGKTKFAVLKLDTGKLVRIADNEKKLGAIYSRRAARLAAKASRKHTSKKAA
jgi:hypothetical protein